MQHWDDAVLTTHLINILPARSLDHSTPLQTLFNQKPDYHTLKVFGCIYYPYLRPYNSHKFNLKSQPCIFLGYAHNHKGYMCLAFDGKVYISRHVVFDESHFTPSLPFLSQSVTLPPLPPHTVPSIPIIPNILQVCPLDSSQPSSNSKFLPVAYADNSSSVVPTLCSNPAGSLPANLAVPTDEPIPHSDAALPKPLPTDIPMATKQVTT